MVWSETKAIKKCLERTKTRQGRRYDDIENLKCNNVDDNKCHQSKQCGQSSVKGESHNDRQWDGKEGIGEASSSRRCMGQFL